MKFGFVRYIDAEKRYAWLLNVESVCFTSFFKPVYLFYFYKRYCFPIEFNLPNGIRKSIKTDVH